MVAVMLIIALIASLAVSIAAGTGRPRLKAVTMEIAALFRRERLGAILTGRSRQVSLDSEHRVLTGDGGDAVTIPRDVELDVLSASEPGSGGRMIVRFRPDGTSSGAVLRLAREKAGYEIRINWHTGGVSIVVP